MKRRIFLILIISVFGLNVFGQKDWQKHIEKMRPLVTTESEVETILGKPIERFTGIGEYETNEGVFTVTYSLGKCKSIRTPKYNVGEGVVIQYDFRPKKKFNFDSLKIDMSGFSTEDEIYDSNQTIEYDNLDKGITYTKSNELLNWVQVYPSNDLDYLQCSRMSD
jgi:hypothetical protein